MSGPLASQHEGSSTADPLLTAVAMPYAGTYYPYGFPVRVESNDPLVIEIAARTWDGLAPRFDVSPIHVRCLIAPPADSAAALPQPIYRAQRNLFTIIADAENFATCDLMGGFGFGWFTPAALADREYFSYLFLEGMVYSLLESLHLLSIHSACVALNGRGVMLAGQSGAGKSSLAYACARRGWTYITDDATVLVRSLAGRTILGESRRFRFRQSAADLFPEFRGFHQLTHRPGGKPTIEMPTEAMHKIRTARECHVDRIIFLEREAFRGGAPSLEPYYDLSGAAARLTESVWPEELPSHADRKRALDRLLTAPMFRFQYSDLDAAVTCLETLVR